MLALETIEVRQADFRLRADWQVDAGRRLALLGPSGGGKSTLLAAIAGFAPLATGRILWQGTRIDTQPVAHRPVGILFQDHNLFGHLDVAQNVGLGRRADLRLGRSDLADVAEVLARVGLEGFEDRRPATLSGGQQGRVALARMLVQRKALWLLDEPFAALGPGLRRDMLGLVAEMARAAGTMVLMVTHDPQDARGFADDVVFVEDGVAHPPVDSQTFFAAPPLAYRRYAGLT